MRPEPGTILAIFHSQKSNPLYKNPILQITALTKFSLGPQNKDRYKANLSDGGYYMKAVFSSELSKKFDEGIIKRYYLVRLEDFAVRAKENNNYLYIQSFSEYEEMTSEYGRAVNVANGKQSLDPNGSSRPEDEVRENVTAKSEIIKDCSAKINDFNPPTKNGNILKSEHGNSEQLVKKPKQNEESQEAYTEIRKIFPHKRNMSFKGRVVSKSEIRKFNTQKGEGKVFSFEVADKTGQIKCVAFSECVDIFYPLIENNVVYSISNGTVKLSNKKFSNATSDFEIHLEKNTEIQKLKEDDLPMHIFKFVKISELSLCPNLIDCLGIVKEVYPVGKIINKSTGKETCKRDLILLDQTGSCRLTIWGQRAEEEIEKDSVVVLKSLKVGEYNGLNISTVPSSQIMFGLDIPEVVDLLSWYQNEGKDIIIEKPKRIPKRFFISEVKDNCIEYATIQACVLHLKEDSLFYESCPSESCNKKVSFEDNGTYRCERCNYTYDRCEYRYMSSIHVGDFTGQFWITLFDQTGNALFGCTARELKEIGDRNTDELHNLVKSVVSKEFLFKLRSRQENYNGDIKLRSNCMELSHLDLPFHTKKMLDAIEKISL